MAWYYTEGTIKNIVVEGENTQFSLSPSDKFCIERDAEKEKDKKGILFIEDGTQSTWKTCAESEGRLFASKSIPTDVLLLIKRDHLPIRIYVEDGNIAEVKRLEIKG